MVNQEFITKNAGETKKVGEIIVEILRAKSLCIAALYGDLGSGKTTLAQGMAEALGIKNRIISPTFVLIREYPIDYQSSKDFYHIDLYRLENYKEIKGLGLEEIFNEPKALIAIEWAEKAKNLLPKKRLDVVIENLGEDRRIIKVSTNQSN